MKASIFDNTTGEVLCSFDCVGFEFFSLGRINVHFRSRADFDSFRFVEDRGFGCFCSSSTLEVVFWFSSPSVVFSVFDPSDLAHACG